MEPCRCGFHPEPGTGVVLYDRPGITSMLWVLAIRDGGYDDIDSLFRTAHRNAHEGFESAARNVRVTLALAMHRIAAVAETENAA